MKLEIEFELKKNELPIEYRRVFMHVLKKCLIDIKHSNYYDKYYELSKSKNFTFSVQLNKPKFEKEKVLLGGNILKLHFSTSEELTGYIFYCSFLEHKNINFELPENNNMKITKVTKLKESMINNNCAIIKFSSPLAIRDHYSDNKDKYYSFSDDKFISKFQMVVKNQLIKEGFKNELTENIRLEFIQPKITVVKHYDVYIESTLGVFKLHADKMILNYLSKAGLGSRKSEGFGMFQIIES